MINVVTLLFFSWRLFASASRLAVGVTYLWGLKGTDWIGPVGRVTRTQPGTGPIGTPVTGALVIPVAASRGTPVAA